MGHDISALSKNSLSRQTAMKARSYELPGSFNFARPGNTDIDAVMAVSAVFSGATPLCYDRYSWPVFIAAHLIVDGHLVKI